MKISAIWVGAPPESSREPIQIEILGSMLVLNSSNPEVRQPSVGVSSLEIHVGGNRQSLLFFESESFAGGSFYLEINLENLRILRENKILREKLNRLKLDTFSTGLSARTSFWLIVILLLGLLIGLIFFRGAIFGGLGSLVPMSWEQKVADQVFTQKLTQDQNKLVSELDVLAKELNSQINISSESPGRLLRLHISSSAEPNAYASLGGHLFVNRGLIQELSRVEQLLGVMAHEIIHIQRRHVVRSVFQGLGVFSLIQIFLGDVSGLLAVAIDQGGPLLNLQYSRELEEEADDLGLQLLIKSQIDPQGLPESLEIMVNHEKNLISQSAAGEIVKKINEIEFLSTHPETANRIARLKEKAKKLSEGQKMRAINFDFVGFKKKIMEAF